LFTRATNRVGRLAGQDHDVSKVAADYMVDQITDTPLVTRGGASPVITLNFQETLSKPAARAFERFCAIHDGLPGSTIIGTTTNRKKAALRR
jgi:hypothetical protein